MGHYDAEYEAEDNAREKRNREEAIRSMISMEAALNELQKVAGSQFHREKSLRFAVDKVEQEFILWQHKNKLLVKDPQILIDILKDEK